MGSTSDPGELTDPTPPPSFEEFQKQTSLMTTCTLLWKELSDHFSSLEQDLLAKSQSLLHKLHSLDHHTNQSLLRLQTRDLTIDDSLHLSLNNLQKTQDNALLMARLIMEMACC